LDSKLCQSKIQGFETRESLSLRFPGNTFETPLVTPLTESHRAAARNFCENLMVFRGLPRACWVLLECIFALGTWLQFGHPLFGSRPENLINLSSLVPLVTL